MKLSIDTDVFQLKSSYSWSFCVACAGAVLQSIASLMFCLGE